MTLCLVYLIVCIAVVFGGVHREKRNLIQFRKMVNSVTDRNALAYNDYGCYCGLGGYGPTLDGIDSCCRIHDQCYDKATDSGCRGIKGPKLVWYDVDYSPIVCRDHSDSCDWAACECDRVAAYCFASNEYHPEYKNMSKEKRLELCGEDKGSN